MEKKWFNKEQGELWNYCPVGIKQSDVTVAYAIKHDDCGFSIFYYHTVKHPKDAYSFEKAIESLNSMIDSEKPYEVISVSHPLFELPITFNKYEFARQAIYQHLMMLAHYDIKLRKTMFKYSWELGNCFQHTDTYVLKHKASPKKQKMDPFIAEMLREESKNG